MANSLDYCTKIRVHNLNPRDSLNHVLELKLCDFLVFPLQAWGLGWDEKLAVHI